MADERFLEVPSGAKIGPITAQELSPEDVKKLRAEKKAKFARILERGVLVDRLAIALPPTIHGEWVNRDPTEVARLEQLGFRIDTEYAPKHRLHDQGTNEAVVGDTVHMICDMDTYQILEEIRRDKFQELHGKPDSKGKVGPQIEEKTFAASVGPGIPIIQESDTRSAGSAEIKNALTK